MHRRTYAGIGGVLLIKSGAHVKALAISTMQSPARTPAARSSMSYRTDTDTERRPTQEEREAQARARRRQELSAKEQVGEHGVLTADQSLALPSRAPIMRGSVGLVEGRADQGASNRLTTVMHSKSTVSEKLLEGLEGDVIFLRNDVITHRTGVGIVFVLVQPEQQLSAAADPAKVLGAMPLDEIRVLSVDPDGPADQGVARKGDVLVGVAGHPVKGKDWGDVCNLLEGPVGSSVNLAFERRADSNPQDAASFSQALQGVSVAAARGAALTYSLQILRGGYKVVRARHVWPDPETYTRTSLFIFKRETLLRRVAIFVCESWVWDKFILLLIFVSSVLLTVVDPLDNPQMRPESPFRDRIETASSALTILFALEAGLQIIARGLYFGKNTYLKNAWNLLDIFVVTIGLMDMIPQLNGLNLTALRALRVLRYACTYAYMHTHMHAYAHACIPAYCTYAYMHTHMDAYAHACIPA